MILSRSMFICCVALIDGFDCAPLGQMNPDKAEADNQRPQYSDDDQDPGGEEG